MGLSRVNTEVLCDGMNIYATFEKWDVVLFWIFRSESHVIRIVLAAKAAVTWVRVMMILLMSK